MTLSMAEVERATLRTAARGLGVEHRSLSKTDRLELITEFGEAAYGDSGERGSVAQVEGPAGANSQATPVLDGAPQGRLPARAGIDVLPMETVRG